MGGQVALSHSACLAQGSGESDQPPGPRSQGGRANQNHSSLSYLLIPCSVGDLGTCGEFDFPPGLGKS